MCTVWKLSQIVGQKMVAKLTQHNLLKQFVEIVVWHKSVIFLDCLHQGQFFSLFSSSSEWVSWLPPWSAEEQTQCSLCSSKGHLPVARTTFQLQEEERVCRTVTSWSSVYDLWARVCAGWSSVHDLWGSVCRLKISVWPVSVRKSVCRLKLNEWQVEA